MTTKKGPESSVVSNTGKKSTNNNPQPFTLNLIAPYSTFGEDGRPKRIPFLVDGLLTRGGFSLLCAKPKVCKSSLARYLANCVVRGEPFLGRNTEKGDVLILNLEDQLNHVDNHLQVLGYDPTGDARIVIAQKVSPNLDESIAAIEDALSKLPNPRLVIIDTFPRFQRAKDANDYSQSMDTTEPLSRLAERFPEVHIIGLVHAKKIVTTDRFDTMLGSTALRGSTSTNIVVFIEGGRRFIEAETRIGRAIPATELTAEVVQSEGADVVRCFGLGTPFDELEEKTKKRAERRDRVDYEQRIIDFLESSAEESAKYQDVLDNVSGKQAEKVKAFKRLLQLGAVTVTGQKQNAADPLIVHWDAASLKGYEFKRQFGGSGLDELLDMQSAEAG